MDDDRKKLLDSDLKISYDLFWFNNYMYVFIHGRTKL